MLRASWLELRRICCFGYAWDFYLVCLLVTVLVPFITPPNARIHARDERTPPISRVVGIHTRDRQT